MLPIGIFALLVGFSFAQDHQWGYEEGNGPSTWGGHCQGGKRQSPIEFNAANIDFASIGHIQFGNYNISGPVELKNTGHGVEVGGFGEWEGPRKPFIEGGGLCAKYLLSQFHFHWSTHSNGSEHTVGGQHFPVELHLVHIKEGLNLSEAIQQSDGIAVLGIFHIVGQIGNALANLEADLPKIVENGTSVEIAGYSMGQHLPLNLTNFYRYNGSLTTPECNEAVIWTVLSEAVSISQKQLDLLNAIHGRNERPLGTNVRPVQPINGRRVQFAI